MDRLAALLHLRAAKAGSTGGKTKKPPPQQPKTRPESHHTQAGETGIWEKEQPPIPLPARPSGDAGRALQTELVSV